eukprot:scaffold7340_cov266-Pinguiococcus_pyrenoidosus.AAC.11
MGIAIEMATINHRIDVKRSFRVVLTGCGAVSGPRSRFRWLLCLRWEAGCSLPGPYVFREEARLESVHRMVACELVAAMNTEPCFGPTWDGRQVSPARRVVQGEGNPSRASSSVRQIPRRAVLLSPPKP